MNEKTWEDFRKMLIDRLRDNKDLLIRITGEEGCGMSRSVFIMDNMDKFDLVIDERRKEATTK